MTTTTELRQVRDNAAYAWRNCTQTCLHALPGDFVYEYRELLDGAATTAMETALPDAWRHTGLGFSVRFVSEAELEASSDTTDEWYWAAWDKAAESIDPWALVAAAGLDDEIRSYMDE